MARLWQETLSEIGEERFDAALRHVLARSPYFPKNSDIRKAAGLDYTIVDPFEAECRGILRDLIEGMRGPHGKTLTDIRGRYLYGKQDDPKDAEGHRVPPCDAPRAADTVFPMTDRVRAALVEIGNGSIAEGIAEIADHPSLSGKRSADSEEYQVNRIRKAKEVLELFAAAYRKVQ